jgi:catalase (peroxidase I)
MVAALIADGFRNYMRTVNANFGQAKHGVLTRQPEIFK